MTGLQYTLMYNAKTNLTYAAYEAARAGAIEHASPAQIEAGLLKGMLPYLSANRHVVGNNALLLEEIKQTEAPFMKIEIINPTDKAFDDFNNPILQQTLKTDHKVIPNKQVDLENLQSLEGTSSGMSIFDANVLKLRITYGYKPSIPFAKDLFSSLTSFISAPKDAFSTKLLMAQRIPIVVDVSAQMLSPAVQNGLPAASNNPGNSDDYVVGEHEPPDLATIPDLSEINLPDEYEGMSREEIIADIKANGGVNTRGDVNDKDWIKLLVALGVVTLGASQLDHLNAGLTEEGSFTNSDWVSDLSLTNNNSCSFDATSGYGVSPDTSGEEDNSQDY
jgi:hypothetical protein